MSFEALLASHANQQKPSADLSNTRKWSFSVSVGQAMDTRSKSDLSLGGHISYALSSRLSIASGISYSELGGAKNNPLPE